MTMFFNIYLTIGPQKGRIGLSGEPLIKGSLEMILFSLSNGYYGAIFY